MRGGSRRASKWLLVGRDHGRGRRGGGALWRSRPGEGRRGGGAVRRSRPEQGRTVKELSDGRGLGRGGARPPAITSWGSEARWRGSGDRGLGRGGALGEGIRRRRRSLQLASSSDVKVSGLYCNDFRIRGLKRKTFGSSIYFFYFLPCHSYFRMEGVVNCKQNAPHAR